MAKRFEARMPGRKPTFDHAGVYSSIRHYLEAVKAINSKEPLAVMAKMRETPINDFMSKNAKLRIDGRVVRDMYLFEVKKPSTASPAAAARSPSRSRGAVVGFPATALVPLGPQSGR